MKKFELKPSKENIYNTFIEDSIGRDIDVCSFISLLDSLDDDYDAIAINGGWGCGKTFFVKQIEMILAIYNNFVTNDYADKSDNKKKQYQSLCKKYRIPYANELYLPIYYDAWKYDNDDDPVLSIIYEIISVVNNKYEFDDNNVDFMKLFKGIADLLNVSGLYDIINSFKRKDELNDIVKSRNLKSKIDEFLDILPIENANKVVVFVDELDRCKPSYAICVLERIKHYFDNDRVIFVFSTNLEELQHSIKCVYGDNFNAYRYLDRFFDLKIPMLKPDLNKFLEYIDVRNFGFYYDKVAKLVIEKYNFELRDISKFYCYLKMTTYNSAHIITQNFHFTTTKNFCLRCLSPLLIGLFIYDISLYNSFISGKDSSPFLDIFIREGMFDEITNALMDDKSKELTPSMKEEKYTQLYNAIFNFKEDKGNINQIIGDFEINRETKKYILGITSFLSELANDMRNTDSLNYL